MLRCLSFRGTVSEAVRPAAVQNNGPALRALIPNRVYCWLLTADTSARGDMQSDKALRNWFVSLHTDDRKVSLELKVPSVGQ